MHYQPVCGGWPLDAAPLTVAYAARFSQEVAPLDRLETEVSTRRSVFQCLVETLQRGHPMYAAVDARDDTPVAVFGVSPLPQEGQGAPWLLSSRHLGSLPGQRACLAREAQGFVRAAREQHRLLLNAVLEANTPHVRFITWLGFDFTPEVSLIGGMRFRMFYMEGEADV